MKQRLYDILNNVDKTAVVLPPGVRPPMRAERSGVGVPNLCEAMGELDPYPLNKIWNPKSLDN